MVGRPVYIYALCEPDEPWNIRYVGKTVGKPQRRLNLHISKRELSNNTYRTHWLKSLLAQGKKPLLKIIDVADESTWEDIEKFYIKSYRQAGFRLTNLTDGGEGALGCPTSPLQKQRSAAVWQGKKMPKELRRKLSLAHIGEKHSPEHTAKIAAANTGKKRSPEACANLANSLDRLPNGRFASKKPYQVGEQKINGW